jgi:hypothetical protein
MRNSSILIMVFAVMSAVSAASAEGIQINFDGRATDAMTFKDAVKLAQEKSALVCHQVCSRDEKGTVTCWEECNLPSKSEGGDSPAVPEPTRVTNAASDISSMSKEELEGLNSRLDSSIKTAINYCNKNRLDSLENNFKYLLAQGTIKEKYGFVYNTTNRYAFQKNESLGTAIMQASLGQEKGGNPYCVSWGSQQVCVPKQTCNNICDAAAIVCVASTIVGGSPICSVAPPICHLICNNTSECHDVPYCTQWETEVI